MPELAATMVEVCGIKDGDVLIGSSLGGMVACEITKLRRIPRLFLVGSATRKEEVSTWMAKLHSLADIAPIEWLRLAAGKIPAELATMFAESDPEFVRTMCKAIFHWEGLGGTDTRVFRLHGRYDLVIPPPADADLLLAAGHLIAMSHAPECAVFVAQNLKA